MRVKENAIYSKKNRLLQFLNYSKAKEIITALKRTPRWDIYSNQEKINIYHTLTDRKFIGNIENIEEVTDFVNKTIIDLNNKKREKHINQNGFLEGTLNEDGNTRDHTKEQRKITKKYGNIDRIAGLLSKAEHNLLITTTDLHDIGEGARGDVVYDNKNTNSELFERKCGEVIINSLLKDQYKTGKLYEYIQEAYDINFNDKEHLQIFFKAYEIISYIKGAMIATYNNQINSPHRLVHNVLINQIKKLPNLKTNLPSINFFIKEHEEKIDGLFLFIENSDFFENGIPNGKSKSEYKKLFEDTKSIRENIKNEL